MGVDGAGTYSFGMQSFGVGTRRPRSLAIAAVALAGGLTLAACSSDSGSAPSTPSVKAPTSETAAPATEDSQLGQPVTVGSFTYTIESVKNIGKTLSSDEGESLAQGEFVVVKMAVTNDGSAAANVVASNFTATTANGQSVQAQENDSVIANGTNPAFRQGIGAGKTEQVSLVFDFSPAPKSPVTQLEITDGVQTVAIKVA